jgi:hypothetical protein
MSVKKITIMSTIKNKMNLSFYVTYFVVFLAVLAGCNKSGTGDSVTPFYSSTTFTAYVNNNAVVLSNLQAASQVPGFVVYWSKGFDDTTSAGSIKYTVQIDKSGNNFAAAAAANAGVAYSYAYTAGAVNGITVARGGVPGSPSNLEARVIGTTTSGKSDTSATVTFSVTPYPPPMYIVGDFQGWNIDNPPAMLSDATNLSVYHFNTTFNANTEFKIYTTTGDWGATSYRPLANHPPITETTCILRPVNYENDDKWLISTAGNYDITLDVSVPSIEIKPK